MAAKTNKPSSSSREETVKLRTNLFNTLVLPHLNLVYRLCINYTFSSADVQDNYNEVLVNVFKYIHTYDPNKSIQCWLHIVTKRYVYDMNRKNSRFKRSEDIPISHLEGNAFDPDSLNENWLGADNYRNFLADDILNALDDLKPIYRDTLMLQLGGYRLEEIVEICHENGSMKSKNIDTVKSRLFLAKKHLRSILTRNGERKSNRDDNQSILISDENDL